MIRVRLARDRGRSSHGWLDSRHTFSFADYYDAAFMGFRSLRVINEDRAQPGRGFGQHAHRDMEIVTYVIEGGLEHADSLGNGSVIRPGDVQRMSAGTGIAHSEFNASRSDVVHFLQIWIVPERAGLTPSYEQRHFAAPERAGRLRLVASQDGRDGSVVVHQDVAAYASVLEPGGQVEHAFAPSRHGWLQVVRGALEVNDVALGPGDGLAATEEMALRIRAREESEFLLFDLA